MSQCRKGGAAALPVVTADQPSERTFQVAGTTRADEGRAGCGTGEKCWPGLGRRELMDLTHLSVPGI